ncbi:Protein AF-9-like protein [Lachnellula hyalina]|uniref:Protein AF-9 homolog n=1 Tax=Lachnellula hyalina TaxID=1316788 RepID=A0A8H8U501_9HELO|nr:Protein AF-9-like protein [Lachnellula hyalina]TVY30734.1 Protein AF-9-like protein [Lachnellula hyalina]
MAPPNNQKRMKGIQVFRPFVFGSTAKLFDPITNPKPPGTPEDHTHSWTVFVKGVDDTDITYWCRKVQFKLHESIPNPLRTIENINPGTPFQVHETGWGEFEINIKLYYTPESLEKPQTFYHHLRLHPYGLTEAEKDAMKLLPAIVSHCYEEQLFNEPYEQFYNMLTSPVERGKGKGTKMMKGGMVGSSGERTALIPLTSRPDQPFSRETEKLEIKRLMEAKAKIQVMNASAQEELKAKEDELKRLKAELKGIVA